MLAFPVRAGGHAQVADEAIDVGRRLHVSAHVLAHVLDGLRVEDVLHVDVAAGAVVQPVGQLLRGLFVEHRQLVEHAARRLAGHHGVGTEGKAFGRIPRRDVGTGGRGHLRLIGQVGRLCRRGGRGRRCRRRCGGCFRSGSLRDGGLLLLGLLRRSLFRDGLDSRGRGLASVGLVDQRAQRGGVEFLAVAGAVREQIHLVPVLHREGDELGDVGEIRLPHGLQLQLRNIELVLHAVLDPHRHQRVQTQLDQRDLTRQVVRVVTHRLADDHREPLLHGLAGFRRPLIADVVDHLVLDDERPGRLLDGRRHDSRCLRHRHHGTGERTAGDGRLEQQRVPVRGIGENRQCATARVTGVHGGQRALAGQFAVRVGGDDGRRVQDVLGGSQHQLARILHHRGGHLEGVSAVG